MGKPVTVLMSMNDYLTFRQWQKQAVPSPMPPEFADEVAAFERLKPTLQAQYGGQVVAIYQGQVVATGDDKMAVLGRVLDEIGPVPCYIEWVEPESPRRARISSAWVKR